MGVDVGLARLSNELIAGGIAAYSLGFLAYAVDAAFGNHAPQLPGEKTARSDVRVPALVGATRNDRDAAELLPPRSSASDAPVEGSFLAAHVGRFAIAITVVGWLLQGGAIVSRGLSVHRLPWGNMYEFTLALTFTAVTAFLVIMMKQPARYLGVFVMTPRGSGARDRRARAVRRARAAGAALHSYWLAIHVTAAIIASGVFTVATAATTMFLVADHYKTATAEGRPVRFSGLARIMPAPEVLDRTAYRAYAFAFPVWTFAVIAGAIWAEYAWGHYWQWDPKETWAFITWVIYAGYLHARATAGWRGRKAAYIALLGFTTILFNFFIVNIFITGMHSYAGV